MLRKNVYFLCETMRSSCGTLIPVSNTSGIPKKIKDGKQTHSSSYLKRRRQNNNEMSAVGFGAVCGSLSI